MRRVGRRESFASIASSAAVVLTNGGEHTVSDPIMIPVKETSGTTGDHETMGDPGPRWE